MKKMILSAILVAAAASFPLVAAAQAAGEGTQVPEEGTTPEEVTLGALTIKFANTDFPSIRLDGESWENTEYSSNGREAVLQTLDRTQQHTITMVPSYPNLDQVEIVVKPEDWKLVKVSRLERTWKAEVRVTFPRKAVAPRAPEPPAQEEEGVMPPAEQPAP